MKTAIEFQGLKHIIKDATVLALPKELLTLSTPGRLLKAIDQAMVSIFVSKKLRPFYLERPEPDYV